MKHLTIVLLGLSLISSCSIFKKELNGRYFKFGSINNSEATINLQRASVDGEWRAPATGKLSCSWGNYNGASRVSSNPIGASAPKNYIYLEWYSWATWARMSARLELPGRDVINQLLLNPPWLDKNRKSDHQSIFIIDFRPNNKVWIKLAKNSDPQSEDEVMILAEGKGINTNDIVRDYIYYEEGRDFKLDCESYRAHSVEKGYYTGPLEIYDKWYTDFIDEKGTNKE